MKIERSFRLSGCSASGVEVVLDVLTVLGDKIGGRLHVCVGLDDLLYMTREAKPDETECKRTEGVGGHQWPGGSRRRNVPRDNG